MTQQPRWRPHGKQSQRTTEIMSFHDEDIVYTCSLSDTMCMYVCGEELDCRGSPRVDSTRDNKSWQILNELLQSGASEAEIHSTMEEFKDTFADYGRDKRSASEFHLWNIE